MQVSFLFRNRILVSYFIPSLAQCDSNTPILCPDLKLILLNVSLEAESRAHVVSKNRTQYIVRGRKQISQPLHNDEEPNSRHPEHFETTDLFEEWFVFLFKKMKICSIRNEMKQKENSRERPSTNDRARSTQ